MKVELIGYSKRFSVVFEDGREYIYEDEYDCELDVCNVEIYRVTEQGLNGFGIGFISTVNHSSASVSSGERVLRERSSRGDKEGNIRRSYGL